MGESIVLIVTVMLPGLLGQQKTDEERITARELTHRQIADSLAEMGILHPQGTHPQGKWVYHPQGAHPQGQMGIPSPGSSPTGTNGYTTPRRDHQQAAMDMT